MLRYLFLRVLSTCLRDRNITKAMLYSPPACSDPTTGSRSDNEYRGKWMLLPMTVWLLVRHFVTHSQ